MSQVLVCDRPVTGLSRGRHTNRNCATPEKVVSFFYFSYFLVLMSFLNSNSLDDDNSGCCSCQ